MVAKENLSAARAKPAHTPTASSNAAKSGLRYEKRVGKQLLRHVQLKHFERLEHNPWFSYSDIYGAGLCCPDFLLWKNPREVIIVEVKLTWTIHALGKVMELYRPVVQEALGVSAEPLIIVRNISPDSPNTAHTLRESLGQPITVMQWFDNGPMLW